MQFKSTLDCYEYLWKNSIEKYFNIDNLSCLGKISQPVLVSDRQASEFRENKAHVYLCK